jgi:hypothetical protein
MSLTGETAKAVCDLMEAQMTSAEFDAAIARNKLLHDCETKGFKHLKSMGANFGGITLKKRKSSLGMSGSEFAAMGAKLVNSGKSTITEWAEKCGRNAGDLRYYCDKYGIELARKRGTYRRCDYETVFPSAKKLINDDGMTLKHAAEALSTSTCRLRYAFKAKGYAYDAKARKVLAI